MSRVLTGLAVAVLASAATAPALAADWATGYDPTFRPAYPVDMAPMDDSLDFEAGIRYFYGMGGQQTNIASNGDRYHVDDRSHFLEVHGLIEDHSTDTYVQGNLGFAAAIDSELQHPRYGAVNLSGGNVAYGGADFGYLPLKTDNFSLGGFVGYQYLNESPEMGRIPYLLEGGGGDSSSNQLEVHGLRLGVTARADVNDTIDFRVDAAAIPYASLSGTYGSYDAGSVFPGTIQGSAGQISGHLYGGAMEAMVGFKPTENFAIRAGVRGYYLTGPTEIRAEVVDPVSGDRQGTFAKSTTEMFRWGPVIELTGSF